MKQSSDWACSANDNEKKRDINNNNNNNNNNNYYYNTTTINLQGTITCPLSHYNITAWKTGNYVA